MRSLHFFAVFILTCQFVSPVLAHTAPCLDRTIPVDIHAEGTTPFVPFSAMDFRARVAGKPVPVISADPDRSLHRILLLIDVSGSMTSGGKLIWEIEFAKNLISRSLPDDPIAILTFDSAIQDTVPFGGNRLALFKELEMLKVERWDDIKRPRRTAIFDSLANALTVMKPVVFGDAICLVSDGDDNASRTPRRVVRAQLQSAGVRLFEFLLVPDATERARLPENSLSYAFDLAAATGGKSLLCTPWQNGEFFSPIRGPVPIAGKGSQEIDSAARAFHDEIANFERVTLRLPGELREPAPLKLEVVDASGKRMKHVEVAFPREITPCTQPQAMNN